MGYLTEKEPNRNSNAVIFLIAAVIIVLFAAGYLMKKSGPPITRHQSGAGTALPVEDNVAEGQFLPLSDTNIILEVTSDKTAVSVNEKIKLSYNLYTRYNTRYEGLKSEGHFRGFWIEQTKMSKEVPREVVVLNGKRYVKASPREMVLSPIYSGDLVIDPGIVKASIAEDPGENIPMHPILLASKPLRIHVEGPAGKTRADLLAEFSRRHGMKVPSAGIKTDKPALIILLDISGSMMAEDMQPQNRLASAKKALSNFLQKNNDMMIGLKCFSKDVIGISPLTQSKSEVVKALEGIHWGLSKEDGTSIGDAVFEASKELSGYTGNKKAIILLTDGVNNSGHLDPLTAIDIASQDHITVHTVALGTKGLVPFPVNDPKFGDRKIMARVGTDEQTLARMAEETGGKYGAAQNEAELEGLLQEIQKAFSESK